MNPPHSGAAIIRQVVPTGIDREPARRGKLGFPSKLRILPSVMAEQCGFPRWILSPTRFLQTARPGSIPPLIAPGSGRATLSFVHRDRPRKVVMELDGEAAHREIVDR